MQAAIASLFELPLDAVPNFIEFDNKEKYPDTNHLFEMNKFYVKNGYTEGITPIHRMRNDTLEKMIAIARFDGGVNGYFYATVPSQTYPDVFHAVIVDSELNIVHDPNPNQLAMKLNADDVVGILTVTDFIIGKTVKLFKQEEWDNATEEERRQNTHYPEKP